MDWAYQGQITVDCQVLSLDISVLDMYLFKWIGWVLTKTSISILKKGYKPNFYITCFIQMTLFKSLFNLCVNTLQKASAMGWGHILQHSTFNTEILDKQTGWFQKELNRQEDNPCSFCDSIHIFLRNWYDSWLKMTLQVIFGVFLQNYSFSIPLSLYPRPGWKHISMN